MDRNNRNVYTVYYYTPGGQKLGAYQFNIVQSGPPPTLYVTLMTSDRYFGSKRLAPQDRLGSAGDFYPYGEAKGSNNPQDTWSYATYWRDSATGLDYANQRYFSNQYGRFMTPDPYGYSANSRNPQSLNRYDYLMGNPINFSDPTGLAPCTSAQNCGAGGIVCGPLGSAFAQSMCPGSVQWLASYPYQYEGQFVAGGEHLAQSDYRPHRPRKPKASCGVGVAFSGTPINGQDVTSIPNGPPDNTLGAYTTSTNPPSEYVALQIQATLIGDINGHDWNETQTAQAEGSYQSTPTSKPVSIDEAWHDDSPGVTNIYIGQRQVDWLDDPGATFGGWQLSATFTFTATVTQEFGKNPTKASCSVTFGFTIDELDGAWSVSDYFIN